MQTVRSLLQLLLLSAAISSHAADFEYRVNIEAPQRLQALLNEHLRIVALRDKPEMNIEQLRRVYRQTPEAIAKLLATEGYFEPKIDSSLEQRGSRWIASFEVDPGDPALVTKVDIRFSGHLATVSERNDRLRERLLENWRLTPGTRFRQDEWEAAKRTLLQPLLNERFPGARLAESEARVDVPERSVSIAIDVDSGPVFTFGALEIEGLQRYSPNVVQRLNPITPGQEYSHAKLLDFQQALQETGYFASAVVSIEPDPARPQNIPVRVVVNEARARRASIGLGYSTDAGARVTTEYQHANVFGRGWRWSSALRVEALRQTLEGELRFPRTRQRFDDRLGARYQHQDIQGETVRKSSVTATRARTRGRIETALSLTYQHEERTVAGAEGDRSNALVANYSWTQRKIDSLIFPTRGHVINLQAGGAPQALPDSTSFVRAYARGNYFRPVGEDGLLVLRSELGLVGAKTRRHIPSDYLFRAGGDTSVRGYAYQSLGVREGDAIVGGRTLAVGSIEYDHYFTDNWGGAIFYDVGGASDTPKDLELNHGFGVGARWKSPIGPLNVDVAYGQQVRKVRLHFSVGLAF